MPAPPVKTSLAAPERSLDQRMEALKRANDIRTARAKLKKDLKASRASIHTILLDPPEYVLTAKVFDMLLAVPKYGRVKTNRILNQCRISPSKTIGGLSERQRTELISLAAPLARPPRAVSISGRMAQGLRHHRALRGRQGHPDQGAAAARARPRALDLGDDPRRRARARSTGATTTSSRPRSSSGGSRKTTSSSSPPTAATATAPCAREVERRLEAGHSVVLEIEVQGAQQVRAAKPDSVQIFIAPPDPAVLRERLAAAAPIPPRRSTSGWRSPSRSWPPRATSTTCVVNDELDRAAAELEGIVRAELAPITRLPANDQTTRRQAPRAR